MPECKKQTSQRSVGSPRQWRKVSVTKNDHFLKLCQQGQLCRHRRRKTRHWQLREPLNVPARPTIKAPRYHYKGRRPECGHGLVLLNNYLSSAKVKYAEKIAKKPRCMFKNMHIAYYLHTELNRGKGNYFKEFSPFTTVLGLSVLHYKETHEHLIWRLNPLVDFRPHNINFQLIPNAWSRKPKVITC